jgi:hypothetical protein
MTAPAGSLFSTQASRIREVINSSVDIFLPTLDPVFRDTIVTSQGVGPASAIGRDMKILKVFMGSLAGVLEQAGPRADFPLYCDPQDTSLGAKVFTQGVSQTFPNPLAGAPNPRPYRLGIPMRAMVANIAMTLGEMTAEATPALIGEVIAPKMEGFGRNIAHTICTYFYLNQNDFYKLAGVANDAVFSKTVASNKVIRFSPDNLATDRFAVGQRISFYNSGGATIRTAQAASGTTIFIITRVDELRNVVECRASDNTDVNNATVVVTDIVVYAGSRGSSAYPNSASAFTGLAGINSWLKGGSGGNDNVLLGAERDTANEIDVTVHSEFKSMIHNAGGEPLTELQLRKIFRRFHAAKNKYGQYVDCIIASDGVWLAHEATKIGRERLDRTGRLSSMNHEGSEEGMTFTFDGRSYSGYTSNYVASGEVYAIRKGGNNWKRYVPPSPKGTTRFDRAPEFAPFEFVGSALTGTSSIQIPYFDTSGANNLVTEVVQLPGMMRMQLAPDQPAGIKLTNVAEERLYSDS